MRPYAKKIPLPYLILSLLILLSGCVPALQTNQDSLEKRARGLTSLKMVAPEIKIYAISAGDVSELRDDWSAAGRKNAEKALLEGLKEKGVRVSLLKDSPRTSAECEDVLALYKAVIESVYTHTVMGNPNFFPDKLKNFDYTVGSLSKVIDRKRGEGLLIVYGSDEISSTGRKALRVVQAINPFAPPQLSGVTFIHVALVDGSGDLLWWKGFADSGGYDLRDYESAKEFVRRLLEDFPGGKG